MQVSAFYRDRSYRKFTMVVVRFEHSHTLPPLSPDERELQIYCGTARAVKGPLPLALRVLVLSSCWSLVRPPALPASLEELTCEGGAHLRSLPPLPIALKRLSIEFDHSLLRVLPPLHEGLEHLVFKHIHTYVGEEAFRVPPLPTTLATLRCGCDDILPDTPPHALRLGSYTVEETRPIWRERVSRQHEADRRRVVAHLPSAAALYV
jgi:hypothetical protein